MNIKFSNEDRVKALEIFKAIDSKDKAKSWEAQTALAAVVGPVIDQVLAQAATSNMIYETIRYDLSNGAPSIPIDTYFGNTEGALTVWSQNMPGGLGTNLVSGADEYRFTTHSIFSAICFLKKYVAEGRLDVLTKGMQRLAEEVLAKQEWQAWHTLLGAVSGATTDGATHGITATTAGTFQLDDLNRLATKIKRLRKSWLGGTPVGAPGRGLTDLFVSPEIIEDIRAMAYNPVNTRSGKVDTSGATSIALPDAQRLEAWNSGGAASFLGVRIHELLEFGVGQAYNALFDALYSGSPSFASGTQEIVLGADLSMTSAVKVEGTDRDADNVFRTEPDDQFLGRSKKVGWYGEAEMGFMVADVKNFTFVVV